MIEAQQSSQDPAAPLKMAAQPYAAAAAQAENILTAAMRTWIDESQAFIEDMARDGAEAMQGLQACRSPLDLVAVEQKWLMAHAKDYVDAGVRAVSGAVQQPEEAAAAANGFRLPD